MFMAGGGGVMRRLPFSLLFALFCPSTAEFYPELFFFRQ